jgi:carbohydrate-binding DOMON domain-containing protein
VDPVIYLIIGLVIVLAIAGYVVTTRRRPG